MADIFISYRRGETDKWVARWLNDRLADSFDVFFDGQRESIDLGASFPDEIDEALAQCRVVFAVIGPDWLDPKNLARLKDEDDWVSASCIRPSTAGTSASFAARRIGCATRPIPAAARLGIALRQAGAPVDRPRRERLSGSRKPVERMAVEAPGCGRAPFLCSG